MKYGTENENYSKGMSFLLKKNNGGLHIPSEDVITVCRWCEKAVRPRLLLKEDNGLPPKGSLASQVKKLVLDQLNSSILFPQLHGHVLDNEYPENHILRIMHLTVG